MLITQGPRRAAHVAGLPQSWGRVEERGHALRKGEASAAWTGQEPGWQGSIKNVGNPVPWDLMESLL